MLDALVAPHDIRRQDVDGAEQIDGAVLAVHCPQRRMYASCGRRGEEQKGAGKDQANPSQHGFASLLRPIVMTGT